MTILDENIPEDQRQLLRSWRVPARQIGFEVGRPGMKDDEIIPLLHRLEKSLTGAPRPVWVVYHNPLLEGALDASGFLQKAGGTLQYSVYRTTGQR